MTVPSQDTVAGPYDGNDSATSFSFNFLIYEDSDLEVIHTNASGLETTLTLGADYTVTFTQGVSGGSVTYPVSGDPLPAGEKLTVSRNVQATQSIDLGTQTAYSPETVEQMADRVTMIVQQLQSEVARCIKVAISSGTSPDALLQSISQSVSDAADHASTAAGHVTTTGNNVTAAAGHESGAQGHASTAQAWAEGTEPGGPGTKSAQEHSVDAAAQAASIDDSKLLGTDALRVNGKTIELHKEDGSSESVVMDLLSESDLAALDSFEISASANGYQKLPSGLIIQWGSAAMSVNVMTFPIAWPNACLSIATSHSSGYTSSAGPIHFRVTSITQTQFSTYASGVGGSMRFIAIGH